ncbi:helix-turn-helix domain-containing protein [Mangrovibacterium marinum]|uniref:AraC-like DNA-binding protein n=1 Tax=Mangrovibacterium marinum TaxID=1639118 RepID=A0A2T5BXE7_9BACT|nr:helix-turn-helix domain-containing protein [Mangrovibacterium marinum]PTN04804.1 AraC-like DNA-binding protein [Mangrovibacterium marinum]
MSSIEYHPITPANVYSGLIETTEDSGHRHSGIIVNHQPSGNSYMDLFAEQVRKYGKRSSKWYAKQMNADPRQFDGAIRCMSGMSAHDWICEYLRLVACDLMEQTDWSFKEVGQKLGMSSSSFSQFFRAYQQMQPWEYRSLKKHGRKSNYFYG